MRNIIGILSIIICVYGCSYISVRRVVPDNYWSIFFPRGKLIEYYKNGQKKFEGFWDKNGNLVEAISYDKNGDVLCKIENGTGKIIVLNEEGRKEWEQYFKDGIYRYLVIFSNKEGNRIESKLVNVTDDVYTYIVKIYNNEEEESGVIFKISKKKNRIEDIIKVQKEK